MNLNISKYLVLIILFSCSQGNKTKVTQIVEGTTEIKAEKPEDTIMKKELKPISVVVVPCSNGYEYMLSLDMEIDSHIEKNLSKFKEIKVVSFPFKRMKGSGYHGVFDKKYCGNILKNVEVDFLILSELKGGGIDLRNSKKSLGYRIRIINTKTLEQINSISGFKMKEHKDVYKSIKVKSQELMEDLVENKYKKN